MTIEVMKMALEALEAGDWYINQLELIVYASDDDGTHENRAKVHAAITALRQAIEEAQPASADAQDAARYRWLRENNHEEASVMAYIHGLDDWAPWADAESVDAAIDAAMKEQE